MPPPETCFHCGEDIPPGVDLRVDIDGSSRPMCCPGCQAVAGLIAGSGLDSFYQQRTAYAVRPDSDAPGRDEPYRIYDDPAFGAGFTEPAEDGTRVARLLLGGMTCAACTWLIEQTLRRDPGVRGAAVNLQQSRLDVRYDPEQTRLSELFARVESLGYSARPWQASARREQLAEQQRTDLRRVAVAGIGMMQVGMFAIALHAGDIQGIAVEYQQLLRWVSAAVASFVVLFSARPFFQSAWRHLRLGSLVMDLPVALAIGLAWLASLWATVTGSGQVYFDSVVMFTFFLLLGRYLEQRVRQRHALAWVDAESGLPDAVTARVAGEWQSVPRANLTAGAQILIRRGDTVPVDARVLHGASAVKEDTFSGEYLPRPVAPGDLIYAGTVNLEGRLEAEALGSYLDTRLAALQRSVEVAQTEKPRLAQLADRVAGWFVGAVLLVTALTGLAWFQLDPERWFWVSLSVLVISCPCALALATPAALTGAAGALRSRGVIVRGENALEALSRCGRIVFDKTGTLTEGRLVIRRVVAAPSLPARALALTAALQRYSSHPLARAFADIEPGQASSTPSTGWAPASRASWTARAIASAAPTSAGSWRPGSSRPRTGNCTGSHCAANTPPWRGSDWRTGPERRRRRWCPHCAGGRSPSC